MTVNDEDYLVVQGGIAARGKLATNISGIAEQGRDGEHRHFEYFSNHFYLSPSTAPVVILLKDR